MSDKLKLIFTSTAITILTSTAIIIDTNKSSANPFSKLLKNIKSVNNSLTLSNPFKTSNSINFNKPYSNGRISSTSSPKNLWTKFKSFFTSRGNKISSTSTTTFENPKFKDITKITTITHTLKGTDKKISESKNKRARLADIYSNDIETSTTKILSVKNYFLNEDSQETTKLKPKIHNPNINNETISISSENESSKKTEPIYVGSSLESLKNLSPKELEEHSTKNNNVDLSKIKLTPPEGATHNELYDFAVKNPVITHHVDNEGNIVTVNNAFFILGIGDKVVTQSHLRWANGKGFDQVPSMKVYMPYSPKN